MTQKKVLGVLILISLFFINVSALDVELYDNVRVPAVVNNINVNVRDDVGLSSNVKFKLQRGEYIYLLGQTKETQPIGEWNSVWYKALQPGSGEEFWIYGEFVTALEGPASSGVNNPYFCYIDENDVAIANGVYKLSRVSQFVEGESLFSDELNRSMVSEMVVYNNTLALFLEGKIQPLSIISDSFIQRMSLARNWSKGKDEYDVCYRVIREHAGMMSSDELYFGIKDDSLTIEEFLIHSVEPNTGLAMTYTKDFEGDIFIKESIPKYPKEYFILSHDSYDLFSAPDVNASTVDTKIPGWRGELYFTHYGRLRTQEYYDMMRVEIDEEIKEEINDTYDLNFGDFRELSREELPLFTVVERMVGNAASDSSKRWYKVLYEGTSGYIIVDPYDLETADSYFRSLGWRLYPEP
ncbi:MAG: hypothetical protein PQJ60_14425 [Spirochaetales bacterium]|nr:hypothetical protein [Spirochaetales bacterium]